MKLYRWAKATPQVFESNIGSKYYRHAATKEPMLVGAAYALFKGDRLDIVEWLEEYEAPVLTSRWVKGELEKLQETVKANGFGEDGNKQADVYLKIRDLITRLEEYEVPLMDRETADKIWEAGFDFGGADMQVLSGEASVNPFPDKEAFLDEMFNPPSGQSPKS